ncbi:endonuclease NucS domain-containing protein [Paenibacillus wulumuqiensis]|uniref:endonuclease NucS domain-containing protein n=1 Tax=Paenibacillus wulumuqiensis TaxID=1567107 RepID=UPI0006194569|nr:endonuclease NucS domain-containing protein [Paenibacillus wulumuqiensis]
MGDIKLFRLTNNGVEELHGYTVAVEKSLQTLMERNLEVLIGIRFLASEYSTGKRHGGRIDTLGIDENNSPVIIEYKRATNENVINQGLYYLDWLMNHQAEFKLLVMDRLGVEVSKDIDWSAPRLLCVAGGFTKYDEHAVQQINRNIELYTYKRYGEELLLLDLVNATTASFSMENPIDIESRSIYKTVSEYLSQASPELVNWFEELKAYMVALGDDVQVNTLKYYVAFKRIKNFACVEIHPQTKKISLYLKVDPDSIELETGFTRDVRKIGHYGTGDLEVTIGSLEQLERAKELIQRSYELN